jgi:hypothetical protein
MPGMAMPVDGPHAVVKGLQGKKSGERGEGWTVDVRACGGRCVAGRAGSRLASRPSSRRTAAAKKKFILNNKLKLNKKKEN